VEGDGVNGRLLTDLVDPEPLVCGPDEAREMPLDILNVVQLRGEGVVDIDNDDFPVGLAFIEEGHNSKHLDLLNLTNVAKLLADLTDIQGVVVTTGFGLGVGLIGVFPSLQSEVSIVYSLPTTPSHQQERDLLILTSNSLEGKHRSSRYNHGEGSSCERNAVCPS
jgi:hypothetical protein